jgi:asparagine synthase (glutamine-hydrolysing)
VNLFTTQVQGRIDIDEPRGIFERVFTFNDKLSYNTPEQHINNSLYFEAKTFLPGLFLVGDKLSMAHGLEERFPFMDNDLVNFAMKIPVRHKLGNLEKEIARIDENDEWKKSKAAYRNFDDGKNVLRKAMMDFIPQTIIDRKKQGFSAPDESWYRGENASFVRDLLLNKKAVSTNFINRDYMQKIVKEHTEEHINHRLLIWSFINFESWCKIFLDGEKN